MYQYVSICYMSQLKTQIFPSKKSVQLPWAKSWKPSGWIRGVDMGLFFQWDPQVTMGFTESWSVG